MKAQIAALVVLAGAVSAANAAPKLVWQVSTDNGGSWSSAGSVNAGSNYTIKVRALVDWTGTTAYGFSGLTQQVFIDNYAATDGGAQVDAAGVGNRVGPFNFGAATLATRVTASTQRIVALGIGGAEGNISSGQQAPASAAAYSTANPALIFTFDYLLTATDARTLTFRSNIATSSGVTSAFSFHAAQSSSSTSFRESGTVQNATLTINAIPTPGALAVLGLGGLVAGRRRRA